MIRQLAQVPNNLDFGVLIVLLAIAMGTFSGIVNPMNAAGGSLAVIAACQWLGLKS
jgi:hypothetical protein